MKKNLLAVLLGLVMAGVLVLVAMPLGLSRLLLEQSLRVQYWTHLVQDVDHRPKPGSEPGLNSDNIRAWREASSIRPDDFNIIFLGDSFIFGYLLDVQATPAAELEKILRAHYGTDHINVWNFGWVSSSPFLEGRLLKDLGPRYRPDLVLLSVDMTDFKDDFVYRNLIEGRGIYRYAKRYPRLFFHLQELVARIPALHEYLFGYPPRRNYFVTQQPLGQSLPYFDGLRHSLDEVDAYAHDVLKVPFVVFLPPRHWQYTDREAPASWERDQYTVMGPYALEPFRYFAALDPPPRYPVVPLLADFQATDRFPLCFDGDSHWNADGARFMAERVFAHCQALGCFRGLEARLAQKTPPAQALAPPP